MANNRSPNFRRLSVTVTAPGTPVPLSPTKRIVTEFEVFPLNANTGDNMYIGNSAVNNTWIPRPKNRPISFSHGLGAVEGPGASIGYDLNRIYIDGDSAGDTAIVQFLEMDSY